MASLHFELVSPERLLMSDDVDAVEIPGTEGDMGILPGHAPVLSTLRPGVVTVTRGGKAERISGARFCQVNPRINGARRSGNSHR
jgi:F-type H+-transporting ATPase subunit epsilon